MAHTGRDQKAGSGADALIRCAFGPVLPVSRVGTELCALGTHQKSFEEFVAKMRGGLTQALSERDKAFGDYREGERKPRG